MAIKDDFKDGRLPINQTPGNLISHTWLNSVAAAVNVTIPGLQTQIDDLAESGTSGTGIQVGGSQPAEGWWLNNGAAIPDTSAPTPPTGLTATATGSTTVNLSWAAATDNIGVTGYEYRVNSGAAVDAGAGTTETVGGLTAETTYTFAVRAYDAAGNRSDWSATAGATTPEGPDVTPPTGGSLAVTGSGDSGSTRTLTVSGATDAGSGLHATPYAFSTNGGSTWSAYQSSAVFVTASLSAGSYQPRAKIRDAALNEATVSAADFTITAGPPAYSFLGVASDDSTQATYTFTAQNLGAADANRHIVVVAGYRGDYTSGWVVTVGGVTATPCEYGTSGSTAEKVGIFVAHVPAGATGDVTVKPGAGSVQRCNIALYRLVGTVTEASSTQDNTNGASVTLTVPAGGLLIAASTCYSATPSATAAWTNAAEDGAVVSDGIIFTSAASTYATGSQTVDVAWSSSDSQPALAAVAFSL